MQVHHRSICITPGRARIIPAFTVNGKEPMRIHTGRGDSGQTDLLGERVTKSDPRIELMGALDEATSAIGLGRALTSIEESRERLLTTQRDLYAIMAELAFTDPTRPDAMVFPAERADWLDSTLEDLTSRIELPRAFVVPGDTVASAALDVARTVVRRAERQAVVLAEAGSVGNGIILRYLNRLSSLLFMLARAEDLAGPGLSTLAKGTA